MSTPKEQIHSYIRTWLTNRYVDFFQILLSGQEPNEVNPASAIDVLIKMRYKMTEADYMIIHKLVNDNNASDSQRNIFFLLQAAKKYAHSYNAGLYKSFEHIYEVHKDLGTPFEGIMFHLYCFLKFGIKSNSKEHDFSSMLSYLLTKNISTIDPILSRFDTLREKTKSPRFNSGKAKSKWMDRAKEHNFEVKKRKIVLFKDMPKK